MPLEDNVIIRFTVQQQQLQTALNQISSQLSNIGRQAPQAGRTTQGMAAMGRQAQANTRVFNIQNRTLEQSSGLLKNLQQNTGDLSTSFRRSAQSIQTNIGWLDKLSIQADRASMTMWRFSMAGISLQQLAATTGAVAIGFGLVTKKMVDSFSMVDRIKRQFASIYQSAEIGGKMVDQLVTDAVKIRYTVEQVLEAGRLLAIEGFNPKDLIYDMSDLAAGVNQEGITIVNATRAFVDATNGQFRRLKETFQITREDAMQFAPDAFQGPNNQISNQAKATDAIIRAIRAKYRGMNEATMQTIGGMLSNVDDAMVKSMAKMGQAVEGTVIGWLKTIMGVFEKIEAFADTGLGKAVANTLLWGTAIMGAVTALALLGAGMITILGLFAAYRVFMEARSGTMSQIIAAELELSKITKELAAIEADRGIKDIETMKARLVLLQAIRAEEEARAKVVLLQNAGVTGGELSSAERAVASTGAARVSAEIAYQKQTLPMDIVRAEEAVLAAKTEEARIQQQINMLNGEETIADREQLGIASAKTAEMERQVAALHEQLRAANAGVLPGQLPGVRSPEAVARVQRLQREINVLKRQELLYEGRLHDTSNMRVYQDEVYLERLRERIALKEAELAIDEAQLAAETTGTKTVSRSARFGKGFVAGAGGIFEPLLAPFRAASDAFQKLAEAAKKADWAALFGNITGMAVALVALATIGWEVYGIWKYNKDAQESFAAATKASAERLREWTNSLPATPEERTIADQIAVTQEMAGKMKEPAGLNPWGFLKGIPEKQWEAFKTPYIGPIIAPWVPAYEMIRGMGRQGKSDVEATPMDIGAQAVREAQSLNDAKQFLIDYIITAKKMNIDTGFGEAWDNIDAIRDASAEDLRMLKTTKGAWEQVKQGLPDEYDSRMKGLMGKEKSIRDAALNYIREQLDSTAISPEQRDMFEKMQQAADPAKALAKYLNDTFKDANSLVPEIREMSDILDEVERTNGDDAETLAEMAKERDLANQSVKEMEETQAALSKIGQVISTEDKKSLEAAKEKARVLSAQVDLYYTIKQLLADQNAQAMLGASGMGGMGAIFGEGIAAAEWAAAAGETDPKKRRERLQNALKAARGSREDYAKQALDLYAPGPGASPQEKADYEWIKAQVEMERMSGVEADYQKAISAGNLTPEQRARAERQIAAERRASANTVAGFEKSARDIEMEDAAKQMEARRRGAAVAGASPQQLAQLDMNILRIRMQQAKVNNDITEQMNLQVQAAEIMRGLQDAALGTEEAKLSYMQTQADQGLISQDAVDAEKRQLAAMYQNRARQAAAGSQEYYENMNKALSLLGEDTEEKWSGIIGKILGAPQSLIDSVVSSGWITQGFGGMENVFGMGRGMQAEIASQSRREVVVRVSWDNLDAVSNKVEAVLPQAMSAFGREFARGMSAA